MNKLNVKKDEDQCDEYKDENSQALNINESVINKQDPILQPLLEKYTTGYKPLSNDTYYLNKTEDELNYYTDNPHTDIDDDSNKLNLKNKKDKDDEYKYDN